MPYKNFQPSFDFAKVLELLDAAGSEVYPDSTYQPDTITSGVRHPRPEQQLGGARQNS